MISLPSMRGRLGRWLACVVTGGILFLLFRHVPFGEVIAATRRAAWWTIPGGFLCLTAIFFADAFAIWKTFGWFLARMSFADVLLVRGASYLLAAINYNVGQGALVYFVHTTTGAPILRGLATVLLIMGINVLALLGLTTIGAVIAPDVPHAIVVLLAPAYAGLSVYALVLAIRPRWLANRPILDVLLGAGLGGHVRALGVRLPHIATVVIFQLVMFRGFRVAVPLVDALAIFPLVFFVAALPISVQGLGTTQATMVYFFARYAPGDRPAQQATVLAASLVTQVVSLSFEALLGTLCLRSRVGRTFQRSAARSVQHNDGSDDANSPQTIEKTT